MKAIGSGRRGVKVSAPYLIAGCDHASLAARLLAEGGPKRLLPGSDWRFVGQETKVTYRQLIESFERVIPDAAAREQIGWTAARLYTFA